MHHEGVSSVAAGVPGVKMILLWAASRAGPAGIRQNDMKGDRVEIVIDAGGSTKTYDVSATRAGRRVEVVNRRGLVEVSELTRGGTTVRTARFMASRVLALVEHPAPRRAAGTERAEDTGRAVDKEAARGKRPLGPAA